MKCNKVTQESLDKIMERAKEIVESQKSNYQKDIELAEVLTEMEDEYMIPMLRDPEWESKHPNVIDTYRKISSMRTF